MAGGVDVLLRKIDEGVAEVRKHYEADLAAKEVSDELLYAIMHVVSDCLAALDRTANAVKGKYGPSGGRSPYFPLRASPEDFEKGLDEQIKGLRQRAPHVADAMQRHQPYQPDHDELGYLHKFGRVNKHQDFTAQTRHERRAIRVQYPGSVYQEDDHGNVSISPVAGSTDTRFIPGEPSLRPPERIIYVDWRFTDPPVSVLRTLERLAIQTRSAVEDVHREAAL